MARAEIERPGPIGVRLGLLLSLLVAGALSMQVLDLSWRELMPSEGGLRVAGRFFSRALSPALTSESRFVPEDAPPLLWLALQAAGTTLRTGAAAMSLALVLGLTLGFLASSAWWAPSVAGGIDASPRRGWRIALGLVCAASRGLIVLMRSIHELLWAVVLLAALGLNELAAVIAIAIPSGGTLAKVFSELVDEAPREAAAALRSTGATGLQTYCVALLPAAMPDLIAYTFYRFECILRSSAVLGFFGFPTLGLYIRQSFSSTNYGEVWTFLYALFALLVLFDVWSAAVRRRVLA